MAKTQEFPVTACKYQSTAEAAICFLHFSYEYSKRPFPYQMRKADMSNPSAVAC